MAAGSASSVENGRRSARASASVIPRLRRRAAISHQRRRIPRDTSLRPVTISVPGRFCIRVDSQARSNRAIAAGGKATATCPGTRKRPHPEQS